jgi:hypothetical protein
MSVGTKYSLGLFGLMLGATYAPPPPGPVSVHTVGAEESMSRGSHTSITGWLDRTCLRLDLEDCLFMGFFTGCSLDLFF